MTDFIMKDFWSKKFLIRAIEAGEIDNRERQILLCRSLGKGENRATWPCALPGEMKNPRAVARTLIDTCSRDVCPSLERRSMVYTYIYVYNKERTLKGKVMHTFRDSSAFARNIVPRKVINGPPRTPSRNLRQESPFSGLARDPISEQSRYFRAEISYFFFLSFFRSMQGQRRLRVLISKICYKSLSSNEVKQRV